MLSHERTVSPPRRSRCWRYNVCRNQNMKLYELAYACRLYQGEDDYVYRDMRKDLGDDPNMGSPQCVLQFLNRWGCRISKQRFGALEGHLERWADRWIRRLPHTSKDILSLEPNVIEQVGESFDELLTPHFGNTCAAKTLHALRYRALPVWDAYIRQGWLDKGGLSGRTAGEPIPTSSVVWLRRFWN